MFNKVVSTHISLSSPAGLALHQALLDRLCSVRVLGGGTAHSCTLHKQCHSTGSSAFSGEHTELLQNLHKLCLQILSLDTQEILPNTGLLTDLEL